MTNNGNQERAYDEFGLPIFTDEDVERSMEQHLKELKDKRDSTIIYDAGSGERMTVRQFEKLYGTEEFTDVLVKAAEAKDQYSKETAIEIKKRYKQITDSKVIPIAKERLPVQRSDHHKGPIMTQEQFVPMRYGFIEKAKGAKCHQNPTALLMILLKHRSWTGKMDKHHTYTHWYKEKKLIVASRSIESLADELGVSEKTVRRFLNELVQSGDIKKIKGKNDGYKRENIYVLGEICEAGDEIIYCEQNK